MSNHVWQFFRSGGVAQAIIEAKDIGAIPQLDQKLWLALSCPTTGVHFDSKALETLDRDGDGRIRAQEIIAWVQWLDAVLKDLTVLTVGHPNGLTGDAAIARPTEFPTLPLDAIRNDTPEGLQVLAAAQLVTEHLPSSATPATGVSLADVRFAREKVVSAQNNGDGIIPPVNIANADLRHRAEVIMKCVGAEAGLDGHPGLSATLLANFVAQAQAYLQWRAQGDAGKSIVAPFGDETAAAYTALQAVAPKVDDYFLRCHLAAYLNESQLIFGDKTPEVQAMFSQPLTSSLADLSRLPLSQQEHAAGLPLSLGINPAWRAPLGEFHDRVIVPLFGAQEILSEKMWREIKATLAPYGAWHEAIPAPALADLPVAEIRALLESDVIAPLETMIAEDLAAKPKVEALHLIENLLILVQHFYPFVNNFISFRDFYAGRGQGIFQAGRLFIDGRSCDLCIWVNDIDTHSKLATLSELYVAYCKVTCAASQETKWIAACITGGDAANLIVGRNGVFYDRTGQDWDATIVKIIDKPISLREAFWLPYRRLGRFVSEQIEKFASSKDKEVASEAASHVAKAGAAATAPEKPTADKPTPPPFDIGRFAGIFAALGLALGAIGTALASVVSGFFALAWWQMPLAIVGLLLFISGPSVLLAWFKLRKRNLGPLLDASGWAINTQARLNFTLGTRLTSLASVHPRLMKAIPDPFLEPRVIRWWHILLALLVATIVLLWRLQPSWLQSLL